MHLFYVPNEKKSGKPILISGENTQVKTSKGVTKAWKNADFTNQVKGYGNITMIYDPQKPHGKSCVLSIDDFQVKDFDTSLTEKYRLWFCKGNFKKEDLKNTPIVQSDHKGKNRKDIRTITLKNALFEIQFNNAISKEKQSGATTILRVFSHD